MTNKHLVVGGVVCYASHARLLGKQETLEKEEDLLDQKQNPP
jgi:hypothetical protein